LRQPLLFFLNPRFTSGLIPSLFGLTHGKTTSPAQKTFPPRTFAATACNGKNRLRQPVSEKDMGIKQPVKGNTGVGGITNTADTCV
jgi:hypothetical protein